MGSIGERQDPIKGIYQIPTFGSIDDPMKRPYGIPPQIQKSLSRRYELHDFRDEVFGDGDFSISPTSPAGRFLTKNGFTAVKYPSVMLNENYTRDDLDSIKNMDNIYYPEIEDLVKKVTGCKTVMVKLSILRGPPRETAGNGDPTRFFSRETAQGLDQSKPPHKTEPGPCLRVPHCDATTLGLRRTIRCKNDATYQACVDAGIIAAEDAICARAGVKPTDEESDAVLAKEYNAGGVAGPRYAEFSIWRPLTKVTRNPLTMLPRRDAESMSKDIVAFPYFNRASGQWGDFATQLTMLRVRDGAELEGQATAIHTPPLLAGIMAFPPDDHSAGITEDTDVKFYWLSEMENDEVLVVKFADSAAIGDGPEADGPMHGSPNLGEWAYGDDRTSLEVRLLAIW